LSLIAPELQKPAAELAPFKAGLASAEVELPPFVLELAPFEVALPRTAEQY